MLKVNSSRAGIVGQLNNLPDVVSFGSSGDLFNRISSTVPVSQELAKDSATLADDGGEMTKDTTGQFDLDITNKGWMIERGFLSLPTTEYGARDGSIESSDRALNPRGEGNPISDEGPVSVAVGGSFSGVIDFNGDTDDIRVFLVTGQTYLVSLRGTGATPVNDTFLEVYNPSAALVNFDDDGGNGINSLMTFTATATGNYTIRASSFSNPGDPGLGGYTVDVRVQGVDAVGDTNATAVVLNYGTTFGFRETATVSGGADLDRYEVQLEAGKFYTFKLAAGADYATDYTAVPAGEIDTILRLRNAAGTLVAQNDDNSFPSDISSGFGFLASVTGTYYLDVTGYAGQTGGYVIDFENIIYQDEDPLQSIRWVDADNIDTVTVNGNPTAYVYFGLAGQTFGEPGIVTFGWDAKEKSAVMSALLEYTKITGITYVETLDINQAEFRLNTVSTGNFGAYFYPQDPAYGAQEGIGIFNVNSGGWDKPGVSTQDIPGDQVSLDKGGFAYAVILHEFGHAHGLAHPHDNGGGSDIMLGVTAPTNSYGIFNLNQGVYTVMSYNDAWDFHPDGPSPFTIAGIGNGWSGTLGAFDIAALQERYGVHAYNTGNDVYTIPSAQASGVYYSTIWDTGGIDTIAYNSTGRATIDLTAATLDYSPTGAGVLSFADQIPGTAGVDGIFGGFTIANGVVIENATGGSGNDTLIGNNIANVLNGNGGADRMIGRGGDDVYLVDNAGDVVTEVAGEGLDSIQTNVDYQIDIGASVEWLGTFGTATTGNLNLFGNEIANTILGNAGNNLLNGRGGADNMFGYAGNDTFIVDNAGDLVNEAAGQGTDGVQTNVDYALQAGQSIEFLATYGSGTTNNVRLTGNELVNSLYGNAGFNLMDGKAGSDVLYGGGGYDSFAFTTALGASNVDYIGDFELNGDKILLDDAIFTGLTPGGFLGANQFVVGNAAADADDRIIYNLATGAILFDADGNGAGAAIQFATIGNVGQIPLSANDFVVI